jgi:DNA transposition AAA+ family ATPase
MTRFRVTWSGVARRTFTALDRPADVLYHLWQRHRYEMIPGLVTFDAAGGTTFPVALAAEVEAADMHAAAAEFRARHEHCDILGADVTVEEVPS